MKKLTLFFFAVLFITTTYAQDATKQMKSAARALSTYRAAQGGGSFEKITGALGDADAAVENISSIDPKFHAKAFNTRGDLYSEVAKYSITLPSVKTDYPDAAYKAYESYMMTLNLEGAKKWYYESAQDALLEAANLLMNDGQAAADAKDYESALKYLNAVLTAKRTLDSRGDTRLLENKEDYVNINQYTGVLALLSGDNAKANELYSGMLENGVEEPFVYDGLYKSNKEANEEAALEWLAKGREKYPEDKDLMLVEIDYYLGKGKMDQLEGKLKKAIEKDPENKILYMVMGNVYESLSSKALDASKEAEGEEAAASVAKSDGYFTEAISYYNQAIEKDAEYFDAQYSLGVLYFNRAAKFTNQANKLPFNEQKKYDALKADATKYFREAYKVMVVAEKINPNDRSLIIAFKELYANTGHIEHSNEYKKRLEGGEFEPYDKHPGLEAITAK